MKRNRIQPGPGQESVWDYPRPPALEPCSRRIRVEFGGAVIAETTHAYRVLETSHPPVYYVPPEDVRREFLVASQSRQSFCEWKGRALYFSVVVEGRRSSDAAWSYPEPSAAFRPIRNYFAFYPTRVDACWVDDERVQPQPGDFYGGWITTQVVGPFKGAPGTSGW
jgi:uncharacterized protein (DUF427 family)